MPFFNLIVLIIFCGKHKLQEPLLLGKYRKEVSVQDENLETLWG
jgi:hypothetical protein